MVRRPQGKAPVANMIASRIDPSATSKRVQGLRLSPPTRTWFHKVNREPEEDRAHSLFEGSNEDEFGSGDSRYRLTTPSLKTRTRSQRIASPTDKKKAAKRRRLSGIPDSEDSSGQDESPTAVSPDRLQRRARVALDSDDEIIVPTKYKGLQQLRPSTSSSITAVDYSSSTEMHDLGAARTSARATRTCKECRRKRIVCDGEEPCSCCSHCRGRLRIIRSRLLPLTKVPSGLHVGPSL